MASEDLYEIRNSLALGNYTQVISEGSQIKANQYKRAEENERLMCERDYLIARAQIGLRQYAVAISDLKQSKHLVHRALCCLAEYLRADQSGDSGTKQKAVEDVKGMVKQSLESEGEANESNCLLCVTAATILIHEVQYEQALEWLKSWATSLHTKAESKPEKELGSSGGINALLLEVHALCVDIFLRMNRPDIGEAELRQMMKVDDDAPLTALWHGWVSLRRGGDEQLREAEGYFEDLKEKFGHTAMLLNGTALCLMAQRKWQAAEEVLEEALRIRENDPDTMVNLMICKRQLRPGQDPRTMIEMVKNGAPNHPWARRLRALEVGFDEAADRIRAA
eukprot:TRINITY_DN5329_c0_g2_i1.p1 TRINITY_DN5329_c0_g2~~TRINITY_DN5329_c0_g2_i1.p1  ORF type:complete len:368 (+),score=158.81 TRINITY_DN5329_c0_g2_i1:96-1106(+)